MQPPLFLLLEVLVRKQSSHLSTSEFQKGGQRLDLGSLFADILQPENPNFGRCEKVFY